MLDIRANNIPYFADVQPWAAKLASLAIKWNAVVVVHHGDYFMKSQSPKNRARINVMIQEFESPGCICLWPSVLTDKQQTLLRPLFATIEFPYLDWAARHQRWLQLFDRDNLAATFSGGKHASVPNVRDIEMWTFLREIAEISWYNLDGADIENFTSLARNFAEGQDLTLQHVKAVLKAQAVPLSLRSKVARFFRAL